MTITGRHLWALILLFALGVAGGAAAVGQTAQTEPVEANLAAANIQHGVWLGSDSPSSIGVFNAGTADIAVRPVSIGRWDLTPAGSQSTVLSAGAWTDLEVIVEPDCDKAASPVTVLGEVSLVLVDVATGGRFEIEVSRASQLTDIERVNCQRQSVVWVDLQTRSATLDGDDLVLTVEMSPWEEFSGVDVAITGADVRVGAGITTHVELAPPATLTQDDAMTATVTFALDQCRQVWYDAMITLRNDQDLTIEGSLDQNGVVQLARYGGAMCE